MTMFAPTLRRIKLIDEITLVNLIGAISLISTLSEVTNVKNIESIDLIDAITTITNVANVQNIDLIDLVTRIAEITRIVTIDEILKINEITTIRDFAIAPKSLIVNGSFEQGFLGWIVSDPSAVEITTMGSWTGHICHFIAGHVGNIEQFIPITIDPTWGTWKVWFRTTDKLYGLSVHYFCFDGTIESQLLLNTSPNVWNLKTLVPPKKFYGIRFYKLTNAEVDFYIDELFMVI